MIQRLEIGPRISQAAIHNGTIYLAGQVADDCTQDISGQTRQILTRIDRLLAQAGSDKSRILMAQIFLSDVSDFAAMNRVWDDWVTPGHTPPRATLLCGMVNPDWKLEIIVSAAV